MLIEIDNRCVKKINIKYNYKIIMSFNLFRVSHSNSIDIRINYKQLADEFCKYYYSLYDTNFILLNNFYNQASQFTFQDEEILGFNNLLEKLRSNGYYKFTHNNMKINSQPIGQNNLLINILGNISINDSIFQNKFIETIILQKDNLNKFEIFSTIFKIID